MDQIVYLVAFLKIIFLFLLNARATEKKYVFVWDLIYHFFVQRVRYEKLILMVEFLHIFSKNFNF